MIDRNSQFMAILTNVGAAKLANANALGIPWNLTALGVGDANGTDPVPSATQTKLINEKRRAPLNQLRVDPVNAAVIIAEQVIPADVGGWWIREIGLYDSDGDLVAVSNCAPSFKPALDQGSGRTQIVRMNFIVSSINNIVLKIDPAIVLATREYVDLAITEAINKQDFKHSVLVATTTNIALTGIQTIDGVLLVEGSRVLVKDQTQAKDNGIYVVAAGGTWKRAQDADASVEVTPGLFVSVEKGTANGDSVWQLVTDAPIVLGTTALTFEVVAGRTGITAGTYRSLTVDKYGRVIAGTSPATLAAYAIDIPTQAEAEAQADQDNTKPMTALRVFQAVAKKLGLMAQTGLADATVGKLMLVGAGGLMGAVEPFGDPNAIPWRTGHFGATAASAANGPPGATLGDMVFQEVYNANSAAQHWTCYSSAHKYTRRWNVGVWSAWDEDLTVASIGAVMTATQSETNSGVNDTKYITPKKFAAGVAALIIQATEAIRGIAKLATMAQVDSGSGDDVIVTPYKMRFGFYLSLAQNGGIVFPKWMGGVVIQWGSSAVVPLDDRLTVSFPIEFPNACLVALANYKGAATVSNHSQSYGVANFTKTSFQIENQWVYNANAQNFAGVWLAVGY
ncbi:phage tail protein [Pseudomonas reactans]|uniref:phage tail-collar fiber domain-containing protein n=1 Tax=Pseudomonas reactans TaxID=117680 RepID=UPI0015A0501A|nr:phage tail protein [Pseudomonas reactans]NWA67700.1 phage tail protein [Pseudomonas reactans]